MYCTSCGTQISESAKFCSACGRETNQTSQGAPQSEGLRGFSPRISDPAFAKYVKNANRWSAIFSLVLAVAAVIGFYIAGEAGAEGMSNPQSLYIGFGIGGMFLVIALFQIMSKKRSKTWNGTVEDKRLKRKPKDIHMATMTCDSRTTWNTPSSSEVTRGNGTLSEPAIMIRCITITASVTGYVIMPGSNPMKSMTRPATDLFLAMPVAHYAT